MNFLKRIELQGFKSFAVKTTLEFPARIVGIVGPNGSGKSNIIDAIRWVLGERGMKQLRGETAENLIFAGTDKKASAGLARVALYFEDSGGLLPFELEEAMLVRKIDRTGVSQFFWNDAEIKLKEVMPLLARARLGSRGLIIIGQGQSDLFVSCDAEARRFMIEEMLGLREFRLKKEEAERRLTASQINMEKVSATLEELVPHLRFLRRQKHRFDKRSEIENKLKELENKYFALQYQKLVQAIKNLETPLYELQAARKSQEKEVHTLERALKELEGSIHRGGEAQELRRQLSSLLDRRLALEKELARVEVKIELRSDASSLGEPTHFRELIQSSMQEIEALLQLDSLAEIKKRLELLLSSLQGIFNKNKNEFFSSLSKDKENFTEALTSVNKEIDVLRKEEEALALSQQKVNKELIMKVENLEEKKSALRKLEEQAQNQLFEKEKLAIKLGEIERRWLQLGRPLDELKSLPPVEEEIDFSQAERQMMKWLSLLSAIGEVDTTLMTEAEETEKRYEFLDHELKDLEKAAADLKKLIHELDEKIHADFKHAFKSINEEFNKYFRLMFGGGRARLIVKSEKLKVKSDSESETVEAERRAEENLELRAGVEIELSLPQKSIKSIDMLSGGEKSLVSLAALFALISVSPPPFLVLDEIDAALDEDNSRRFAELIKEFSKKTQFVVVTHNRTTMEAAGVLYGITMGEDGVSKVLSLKLEA